ncbi:fatty acid desaturase family protein [Glycomyces buryatensis]|uniref:Acyl-CoA desaturase n=1 Tax=Glycomyces buryatensis TaxID=2570927 RepID=A0A4S8QKQ4_9ACTN|nr:acyl-CoA desaturase [Glycomyces buryatensis]THV43585.1 acyl-CoA desaturase [Glycomyces buryatensis]
MAIAEPVAPAAPPAPARAGSDFAELNRRISDAGLMKRRPGYYAVRFTIMGLIFAGSWVAFAVIGNTWFQMLMAVFMAVVSAQVALLGHDLAHRQVFRSRNASQRIGFFTGNFANGMGYGWWNDKHNRHHANPNHEELDPDVQPGVLVWSKDQAMGQRMAHSVIRFINKYQAYLFFPLITLEGFNLHVSGVKSVVKPGLKQRGTEAALLFLHFALYLTAVFMVLSPGKAVVFILIHKMVWGLYMGSIFAPNHKGMPTFTGKTELDFLRKQVLTSRNVKGGVVIDLALGGLNYQIEHHLFPGMPSVNLGKAQPIVEEFCKEKDIPYHATGLIESWKEALGELHRNGEPLRNPQLSKV